MRSSHRLALAGVAVAALFAACCSSFVSSGNSGGGTNWANQTSASAGGGMNALVAAAKSEGTLNVIALPPTWANYGDILKAFTAKYGIKINSALPDGSSQQEVNAVKSENGTAKAPDVRGRRARPSRWPTPACSPRTRSATWSCDPVGAEGVHRPVVRGLRRLHGRRVTRASSARSPQSANCSAPSSRMRWR